VTGTMRRSRGTAEKLNVKNKEPQNAWKLIFWLTHVFPGPFWAVCRTCSQKGFCSQVSSENATSSLKRNKRSCWLPQEGCHRSG
jgi:hypothetical protein